MLKHVPQARQNLLLLFNKHPLSLFAGPLLLRANVRKHRYFVSRGESFYGLGADSSLPHWLSLFVQYGSGRASSGARVYTRPVNCFVVLFSVFSLTSMSAKSCYLYSLSENYCPPHCVEQFLPTFCPLYWSTTWRELFFFDPDRPVIDLNWRIAHAGVLYTADRLLSFGYALNSSCLFGLCWKPFSSFLRLPLGPVCSILASVSYVLLFSYVPCHLVSL